MLIKKFCIPLLCTAALYTPVIIADDIVGISKPIHDVALSVAADGVIKSIAVKEGQHVKKGDELLKLDDRIYVHEVNRRELIVKDNAHLSTAQHNKEIIKTLLDNNNKLYITSGAVSEEDVKKIKIQYTSIVGEVNGLASEKKREQAEYEIAKEQLNQRTLHAPISGVITEVTADVGEWAATGKMIMRIVDTSIGLLEVNMNAEQLRQQQLHIHSNVDIEFNTGVSLKKQGTVIFISPVVDTSSSLVRVTIEYDNKDGAILAGTSAKLLSPVHSETTK